MKQQELALALATLSIKQRRLLALLAGVFIVGLLGLLWQLHLMLTVPIATAGGNLVEGVIGSPRFVNPLLANSEADRDLVALIYSGLLRVGKNGALVPDLAESYSVSDDGLTYSFVMRRDLTWHDGEPITSADVEFTVLKAQDPLLKSPRRAAWEGVTAEVISENEIHFTLKQPYAGFLDNATMGILPKHIWGQFDIESFPLNQFNLEAIGSGPYRVNKIDKNELGIPKSYTLKPFSDFALSKPKISQIKVKFYPNEADLVNAYREGKIDSAAALNSENARTLTLEGANILTVPLPRVFGVFFNQNRVPALAKLSVRTALDKALDKQAIIAAALRGYGVSIDNPLGKTSTPRQELTKKEMAEITETLAGLKFTLATSETPELKKAAELIVNRWNELGAQVDLKVYEIGDLNQNVIRPRQYDALFFGEIVGRQPDLFSFWHSSQRLDPGLNVALYTNATADNILGKLRSESNPEKATSLYDQFAAEIAKDNPAIFVYSPQFIYLLPKNVRNVELTAINVPADRLANIHQWFIKTDRVWSLFVNKNNQINNYEPTP